jgi:hypothetical protein
MNHEVQDNRFEDSDDALFDRLVDGELPADERRQLLASLDDRADGWRRCALAFLEAQSWGGAMRQIVREPAPALAAMPVVETRTLASAAPTTGRRRRSSLAGAWLATAAAVFVAFALGWQLKDPATLEPVDLAIDSPAAPSVVGPAAADARRLPDADAITLVVQDRTGAPQRVQVPLVEGRQLGDQFGESPQWADPAVRRRLAEQGLDLQARRRYVPLYFEQKDHVVPMIVPVDDATVTPVSRPVF